MKIFFLNNRVHQEIEGYGLGHNVREHQKHQEIHKGCWTCLLNK
jgi:hypothetical protein